MDLDHGVDGKFSPKAWPLSELKTKVNKWQRFMYDNNGWNALYLENHDQPRAVSRFAHDGPEYRQASAKLIAIFLAFQAGTPFIYQGQEIGMTNVPIEWDMEDYKDIDCLNHWEYVPMTLRNIASILSVVFAIQHHRLVPLLSDPPLGENVTEKTRQRLKPKY